MRINSPIAPSITRSSAVLLLAVSLFVSCDEQSTVAPPFGQLPPADGPGLTPQVGNANPSFLPIGTFSVGNGSSIYQPGTSVPGPTLPNKRLLYRVTATGTITSERSVYWSNGPIDPQPGAHGPSGYSGGSPTGQTCYAFLYLGSTGYYGGEIWYAPSCLGSSPGDSVQGYAYLAGATTLNRASGLGTGQFDCSSQPVGPGSCNTYSDDGQEIVVEKVVGELGVAAAPASVLYGETVTVTASVTPSGLGGKELPWSIDSTRWVPAFGTQWTPCSWASFLPRNSGSPRVCQVAFTRSGVLTVFATVNGDAQSATVEITVPGSHVEVSAVPAVVEYNDTVTFSASISPAGPPWNVNSWRWTPDSGSVGSGISSQCGWNNNPCSRQLTRSGTMTVFANIDGLTDSAKVHVVCLPCLTGDESLDSVSVRSALHDAWTSSQGSPRVETGFTAFDSGGRTITEPWESSALDTPCSTSGGPKSPFPGTPTMDAHTHPYELGDTISSTCYNDNLVRVYSHGYCGFSEFDWEVGVVRGRRQFAMDADSIYVMTRAPVVSDFDLDSLSPTGYRIRDCELISESFARECAQGVIALIDFIWSRTFGLDIGTEEA